LLDDRAPSGRADAREQSAAKEEMIEP